MSPLGRPDGRGGPHTFVDDLDNPVLEDDDRRHLERSLRLRPSDAMTVGDGQGSWRPCRFGPSVVPAGDVFTVARSQPLLTVAFTVVKGARPELVVQKLTELGIDRIVPLHAARSVVRWDERRAITNRDRFERIAREAAMQSRRVWLPVVEPVTSASRLLQRPVALAEPGGRELRAGDTTVLIGPEGGWTADELAGHDTVGLGETILRAETAAIAAATLMVALRRVSDSRP